MGTLLGCVRSIKSSQVFVVRHDAECVITDIAPGAIVVFVSLDSTSHTVGIVTVIAINPQCRVLTSTAIVCIPITVHHFLRINIFMMNNPLSQGMVVVMS